MGSPFVHYCPKCGKPLLITGELPVRGKTARLFDCPDCVIHIHGLERTLRIPFIYAVDEDGEVWDVPLIPDKG